MTTKETKLAIPEPQTLIRSTGPVTATAEGVVFHSFDLRPPLLKISQPTSEWDQKGVFIRLDTEEIIDSLEIVPLRIQATRTKWPSGAYSSDRRIECASQDGITAVESLTEDRIPLFPGATCENCEFYIKAPWLAAEGDEICLPGYSILLMDVQTYEVYGMRLQGTACQIARKLGAKGHLRKSVLRLYPDKVTSSRGTWYKPKADVIRKLGEDELEVVEGQYQEYGIDFEEEDPRT